MKKIILPVFLLFVLSGTIFSQGIYLRAGTGYGLPVATSTIGEVYQNIYDPSNTNNPNSYSKEVVTASYGAGMNFNFAIGYKFNENFIFDLNVQYLIGSKFETSDIYYDMQFPGSEGSTYTTSSKGFMFNPAFIFSAGFGKAAPYGRFGLVASSPTITDNESYYYDLDGVSQYERIWEYKKGMAIGYSAAVGMNWKLTDMLDIYTELNFISLTYYPAEGEMIKYDNNGTDMLPNLYVVDKQKVFEKNYDPSTPYDQSKPQIEPLTSFPFSSASLEVGIRFTIWKKAE
jgi:hypothetical protein